VENARAPPPSTLAERLAIGIPYRAQIRRRAAARAMIASA
jgi:hypothetical protein